MPDGPFQTLDTQIVYRNLPWFALRRDTVRLPDGSQRDFTIVERPGSVWIVPVLDDGRLVVIRNYRYAVQSWQWEIPAGGLQDGNPPEEMARIELAEEIGGTAEHLELMAKFYTMPGIGNEVAYVYLARGVTLGEPHREPTEVMEQHIFTVEEVVGLVERGEMTDGPSALSILLAAPRLR